MSQHQFDFGLPARKQPPARWEAVLRWEGERLAVIWTDNDVRAWFQSWDVAIACVLHPLNDNVLLRIRA